MQFKLSPNPHEKGANVYRQRSFAKNKNALAKKKQSNKAKSNIATFNSDIPIDQRIKLLCTPKTRHKKEDNPNAAHKSSFLLDQSQPLTAKRRESLINKALVSDEFFVESMREFNSFRQTIDQMAGASHQSHRHSISSAFYNSHSFKTPEYQGLKRTATRESNASKRLKQATGKEKDDFNVLSINKPDKISQTPEGLDDFTLSSPKGSSDRRMQRFNSVYDSLSDDEDEKGNKAGFEYNEDKYIFDLNSYFLIGWNYLVFLVVIYATFHSLLELAFNSKESVFELVDMLFDLIFLVDIVITFFTPFIREKVVIKNFSEISMHYLQTFFVFDIIMGLPYELISLAQKPETAVIYSKWPRIFRVVKIYFKEKNIHFTSRNLNLNISEFKFIVVLFMVFFVLIHFASCIWIFLALSTNDPDNWLLVHSPQSESKTDIYVASMYYIVVTVLGVGYGDIYGENNREVLFSIALMLIGQLMFSFVLGSLSRLFEILDSENIQIEAKKEQLSQIALKYTINKTLKANISRSIKQKIRKVNFDYYSFIDSLHNKLKSELILQMHRNHITHLNFFNDKRYDFIVYVLPLMHKAIYSKNEFIFSIGDKISEMYMVTEGCLSLKLGGAYDNIEIGQIRKRSHFGEIQLHFQSQSVYDFKAKVTTEAFVMNQKDFMQVKDNFQAEINAILKESIKIMEVFETRRGLILLLVSYGFSPSMFIPLLRKIDSVILNEDFAEYYFNNSEMRDVYTYVSKLEESQIVALITETFENVKVKPSLNVWINPRQNLINIRTKALIQKLLTFNQGKVNENGQYEFELDQSNSLSDEEKTVKEMACSVNDSLKNMFNVNTYQSSQPAENQKGFSDELKLNQLRKEISLKKNRGKHDMINEIKEEISSLQQLTKQETKENRNRLPLWEGDISIVRKEAKKRNKFSKLSREKIVKQLKDNMELLNGIYAIYKMISIKNQYDFE